MLCNTHNLRRTCTIQQYPLQWQHTLQGGVGACSPRKFSLGMLPQKIHFRPSEIASDTFTLVLIMHLGVIYIVRHRRSVSTWNRKKIRRIGSCLGQDLYILPVFNLRLHCAVYSLRSVSVLYPSHPITLWKKIANPK